MKSNLNRGDTPISDNLSPYYRRVHYSETPIRIKEICLAHPQQFRDSITVDSLLALCAAGSPTLDETRSELRDFRESSSEEYSEEHAERLQDALTGDDAAIIRSCIFHDTLYGNWVTRGAPLFEIGPLMSEEFMNICEVEANRTVSDGRPKEDGAIMILNKVFSRLPFDIAYFKSSTIGPGLGCYVARFTNGGINYLLFFADTGARLIGLTYHSYGDEWFMSHIDMGELAELKRIPGTKNSLTGFTRHYDETWHKSSLDLIEDERDYVYSWMSTLCGLCLYLEAVNKDVVDTTHKVRANIFSGKKSKVRKALNSMVGKHKIWIEKSLEERASREGVTNGQKLSAGHIRRGHLHTYYTGRKLDADGNPLPKDLRKKTVKWVTPTWVGPRTLTEEPREYGIRAQQS